MLQCFYVAVTSMFLTYKAVTLEEVYVGWAVLLFLYAPSLAMLFWILPECLRLFSFLKFTVIIDGKLYGEVVNRMEKTVKIKLKLLKIVASKFDNLHTARENLERTFVQIATQGHTALNKEE
jgi:hypothetical protein